MRWVLVGMLASNAHAFAFDPGPIRWGGPSSTKFVSVTTPKTVPRSGLVPPYMLAARDSSETGEHSIPHFTARPDETITWGITGMCVEASGSQSGDPVQVNRCSGQSNQKWDWKPWGQIQLKDTDQCLDVVNEDGSDGAPITLRKCSDKHSQSWRFQNPSIPSEDPSELPTPTHFTRNVMYVWPSVFWVSLCAWLWRNHIRRKPHGVVVGHANFENHGGVALITNIANCPQMMVPAVMAVSTLDSTVPESAPKENGLEKKIRRFNNLFAVWLALAAATAIKIPSTFLWVKTSYFTFLLGAGMFSVGITTTVDDFKACLDRPGAVAINFASCYGIMPMVAYGLGKAIGADLPTLAGLVLVGAVNGGQASNLCTLIAGGDVALSVLMTTSTTLGCVFMTPLICKLLLGSVVPLDAAGIISSAFQIVLAPIFAGVFVNQMFPKSCAKLSKCTPTIGILSTVLMVGASVAKCAAPIFNAGWHLQIACAGLHLIGGVCGYFLSRLCKFDVRTCRTVAIETAMKSNAFGFALATMHFGSFAVRVPSAVSIVWMAITGSALAVFWQKRPPQGGPETKNQMAKATSADEEKTVLADDVSKLAN